MPLASDMYVRDTSVPLPAAYPALRVFHNNTNVAIQLKDLPNADPSSNVETLSIDLNTGTAQVLHKARFPGQGNAVLTVLGLSRLHTGYALVVATSARRVATLQGCEIFRVEGTDILTGGRAVPENKLLLKLLADAVDPEGSGRDMFFSFTYDLTLSSQRMSVALADAAIASRPLSARAEPRFTWNHAVLKPLVDAGGGRFAVPVVMGFVEQLPNLVVARPTPGRGTPTTATLTLLARRSPHRAGTRHWRRGCDLEGHASNFVETEQILSLEGGVQATSSYVQIRGSIPLLWTEMPNLKYKPTRVIAQRSESAPAFDRHMKSMLDQWKRVVALNLVNQKAGEGKLETAFRAEATRFSAHVSHELHYVPFDFHHECKKKYAEGLAKLWDQVKADFATHNFFLAERQSVVQRQEGVIRSNCIDCLDRTNVVQGILARKSLEMVLRHYDLLPADKALPEVFPQIEQQFKIIWADHGDSVSMQYAGTGAMKSGFTRTGKRTYGGVLDDGVKSLTRYYLNNFQDGRKQDAMDFFTGNYIPDPKAPLRSRAQPSPLVPLLLVMATIIYGLRSVGTLRGALVEGGPTALLTTTLRAVVVPVVVGLGLFMYIFSNGRFLVNRPRLCLQLAYTARKPAASSSASGAAVSK